MKGAGRSCLANHIQFVLFDVNNGHCVTVQRSVGVAFLTMGLD